MKNDVEIKKVFLKLIYSKPIETINVSSICEELNIKRQTFYYHYRDVFELVESIFADYTNDLISVEMSTNYLKSIFNFAAENIYLISSSINGGLKEVINKFFSNLILPYVSNVVYELKNIKNLNNSDIKEIISYHTEALSLFLINAFKNEEPIHIDRIINKIDIFLDKEVLERTASLYYERRREI
jgi:AcrR family transcriptional regulator